MDAIMNKILSFFSILFAELNFNENVVKLLINKKENNKVKEIKKLASESKLSINFDD